MNATWIVTAKAEATAVDPRLAASPAPEPSLLDLIASRPWVSGAPPRPSRAPSPRLTQRERAARREAARAVIGIDRSAGVASCGIDLESARPGSGTCAPAGAGAFSADLDLPHHEQIRDLQDGLAVICARAACDARLTGASLAIALNRQADDMDQAVSFATQFTFVCGAEAVAGALAMGLDFAAARLADPKMWAAVETVANACLAAGGRLCAKDVTGLATPILI